MARKRIPLKAVEEVIRGNGENAQTLTFDYAEVMLDALRSGSLQGMTIGEMGRRLKVIDKLEEANREERDEVIVTPEEHKTLVEVIKSFRFRMVLRSAVDMLADVEYAPDAEQADE